MRILFVENHAPFAQVAIAQFLAGHDVIVAPSLAAARAAKGPFDVVLIDYDLDDGKGDVLVRELVAAR